MTARIELREPHTPVALPKEAVAVSVARTLNDLLQVMAIRTTVYMGEQVCPFDEEIDGNDFAGATHMLAKIGNEPVGVVRMRWFCGFAKLERLAVLPAYRGGVVPRALLDAAFELAAQKGYDKVLGHAQARLVPLFMRAARVKVRKDRPRFVFSDHEYVEVVRYLAPSPNALSEDSDPMVLLRPEGAWDRPGVLDYSAQRPATNPH